MPNTAYLKIAHYPTRLDRTHCAEQRVQLPIGHVLRQVVDNEIGSATAPHAIVDAGDRTGAGGGQVIGDRAAAAASAVMPDRHVQHAIGSWSGHRVCGEVRVL